MSSFSPPWRIALITTTGFREYLADYPWSVILTTSMPRAVLQCLFFTLLGSLNGGLSETYLLIGSLVMVVLLFPINDVADVLANEKWFGTLFRLRLGHQPIYLVFLLRCLPALLHGAFVLVCSILIVSPVIGRSDLIIPLLLMLPIYLLIALNGAIASLAAVALVVGRRADVIVSNGLVYLVVACGGLLVPRGSSTALDLVGNLLPGTHGLLAIRAALSGMPWWGQFSAELLVGVAWAIVGAAIVSVQTKIARRTGWDSYA